MPGTMDKKRQGGRRGRPAAGDGGKAEKGGAGVYKPYKAYRLPMALAELFAQLAEEEIGTDETEHVRAAARDYLIKKGKLKKPGADAE